MKNARFDLQIKTKKITFFVRKNGKGEFLEGEVNLVTGVVTVVTGDGETEKYRQDETTKNFELLTGVSKPVEASVVVDKSIGAFEKLGKFADLPGDRIGQWQLVGSVMKLVPIQNPKYVASLSPSDQSRYGKHATGGKVKTK